MKNTTQEKCVFCNKYLDESYIYIHLKKCKKENAELKCEYFNCGYVTTKKKIFVIIIQRNTENP